MPNQDDLRAETGQGQPIESREPATPTPGRATDAAPPAGRAAEAPHGAAPSRQSVEMAVDQDEDDPGHAVRRQAERR